MFTCSTGMTTHHPPSHLLPRGPSTCILTCATLNLRELLLQIILRSLLIDCACSVAHKRYDTRSHAERIEQRDKAWAAVMPGLVDAYLMWRNGRNEAGPSDAPTPATPSPPAADEPDAATQDIEWLLVDIVREYSKHSTFLQ